VSKENRRCEKTKGKAKPPKAKLNESDSSSSDEVEGHTLSKPKHMLKPPKFNGQTLFETFWGQFTNCAEHSKWNRAQTQVYL